ncbi:VrrA/YqfQ family protein [Lysinibacillus sp. fkY74-1]|uniref:4-hydroxy-3-methylbut-2-enyl diphosphate reductase n=3 Tax=Lysinibacillus TaxID=400634 RepID=W7S0H6_LYSSH|nr:MULTISPECIES: VrrA/YqfQ family protein [Lysinibacillus]MBE5083041.1 4-hydroxy-3-methylbut-2-enyl diphosphate reductase [Bacillus thuringiensis]UZM98389.1 YqfQ family protein [Lysinibacillus sp. MHQ-1]AMO32909.1 4-hydroxy-3-methylbut-2-enyl diphosphate reductase [Lysinibacillus sphaericus]AMR91988.1 4-hydroxy-3-methylbut-2-enyl diphosphate reductase [Lysinibacillus sphaericus]ANA46036.1 4-hydroxy-3-methylbut-2-enyl diphosphate reductase [Lysinibacillus sphaericus]
MVFRPPYPYPMYPGGMRMPMPTPPQMSPQSFFPPGGFPAQPRIPGGFPMANGIGSFGGQMPMPPVQEPSKIGSFLQQANSLFNSAKTYTPYIQQAMPMVKNIPSLLKLYKGFQGLPSTGGGAAGADRGGSESKAAAGNKRSARQNTSASFSPPEPIPSKPRIFQPPM